MVPTFTVTAVAQQVPLDAAGAAQIAFTVTNTTQVLAKVHLRPVATPPADTAWLKVVGEELRDLRAGATEQVAVNLTVPPGTAAGSYACRLDAVSVANPDEDSTQGQSVAFTVAPAAAPKKKFPIWILAIVAVVLVGAIAAFFLLSGGDDDPLASPQISQPAQGTVLPAVPAPLLVTWAPVPGADRYRVEMESCPTPACDMGVAQELAEETRNTQFDVVVRRDRPGRIRVFAFRGSTGSAGNPVSFNVVPPATDGGGGVRIPILPIYCRDTSALACARLIKQRPFEELLNVRTP